MRAFWEGSSLGERKREVRALWKGGCESSLGGVRGSRRREKEKGESSLGEEVVSTLGGVRGGQGDKRGVTVRGNIWRRIGKRGELCVRFRRGELEEGIGGTGERDESYPGEEGLERKDEVS